MAADGEPLPFGELVQVGRAAKSGAITGQPHPAHRDAWMIVHSLVVHMHHSCLQLSRDSKSPIYRSSLHGSSKPVTSRVGKGDGMFVILSDGDRSHRAEDLVLECACLDAHFGKHRRFVEQRLVGATRY